MCEKEGESVSARVCVRKRGTFREKGKKDKEVRLQEGGGEK